MTTRRGAPSRFGFSTPPRWRSPRSLGQPPLPPIRKDSAPPARRPTLPVWFLRYWPLSLPRYEHASTFEYQEAGRIQSSSTLEGNSTESDRKVHPHMAGIAVSPSLAGVQQEG